MYKFKPFLLYHLKEDNYVIQNGEATVIITNNKLVDFLKYLEEEKTLECTDEIFEEYFDDQAPAAIEFLKHNHIISDNQTLPNNIKFENKFLISNDNTFKDYFNITFSGYEFNYMNVDECLNYSFKENDLIIIFLNPFNLNEYRNLCDIVKETKAIIKMIFYYNHSLYITQYYKQSWYNPCPKCFYYSLETQLRGDINKGSFNFQTLVDLIYKQKPMFKLEANLLPKDFVIIMYILTKDFNNPSNLVNNINKVYEIDLLTMKINEDNCYHWEVCDCYE